ncbi:hypothetical protein [Ferrimonas senticii]|uniref:hypothetical protein n=1 Tax=Ferrimonas senticii TaxID=394566 RepID=UPI0003F7684F|nr:hypothetical protein [Ferrimonas senticii]
MKEFIHIHSYLMEAHEVGEWEGQEALAAEHINQLFHAVYDRADSDIEVSQLEQMLESVWPNWQYNPQLLELDDDMIDAFVDALFNHFDPEQGQEDF